MSTSAATYQGLELPSWFDAAYAVEADSLTIAIRVRVHPETGLIPAGVTVHDNHPTATYRDAVALLKGVPMDNLLHDAALMAAGAWAWEQGRRALGIPSDQAWTGRGLSADHQQELDRRVEKVRDKAHGAPRPQRRRSTTPDLLREAVSVYRAAVETGRPPTVAVSESFHVSHRTAAPSARSTSTWPRQPAGHRPQTPPRRRLQRSPGTGVPINPAENENTCHPPPSAAQSHGSHLRTVPCSPARLP